MRKLLPILLALIGLVSGGGAGFVLRPSAEQAIPNPCGEPSGAAAGEHAAEDQEGDEEAPLKEYVKLNNQFIVPVVETKTIWPISAGVKPARANA